MNASMHAVALLDGPAAESMAELKARLSPITSRLWMLHEPAAALAGRLDAGIVIAPAADEFAAARDPHAEPQPKLPLGVAVLLH